MGTFSERQRISRLTPLAAVLERVAALARPVEPHGVRTDTARGLVLGRDVMLRAAWPAHAVALRRAVNIERVSVREPRVLIVTAADIVEARDVVGTFVGRVVQDAGGGVRHEWTQAKEERLARLLADKTADAIIVIGGTGEGPRDASVRALARVGRVDIHGIALRPGETAALGAVGARPVLLLPGRLDAALAVWLTVGARLLAGLTGASETQPSRTATLARKIVSTIGLAEVIPVGACEGGVEPLAPGYVPLQAL